MFERRLIGMYDSGYLRGLGIIMIVENFQSLGKYESISMKLYMCVKRRRVFFGSCVATFIINIKQQIAQKKNTIEFLRH